MSAEVDHPACTDPSIHAMIGRYEFGAVTDEERAAVERHALACDACFAELERGSAAIAHLRARSAGFVGLLRAAAPAGAGAARPEARSEDATSRGRARFRAFWPRPALAAVLGLVVVGAGGWWAIAARRAADPARWASFPRDVQTSDTVRGPAATDAVRELMASGAAWFDLGRYTEAERRFRAALERAPDHAEAAYMAGLSRALAGDPAGAVPDFELAAHLAGGDLIPRARWALANAYLASHRTVQARRELAALASTGGGLGERARLLLVRLEGRSD
jgi:tetratricopeptide (TPR) repeat protein